MSRITIATAIAVWTALVVVVSFHLGRRSAWKVVVQARAAAHHDPLTGLLNRAGLEAAITPSRDAMAVVLIDLDDFKHINDTGGHRAGDVVLATVGHRLHAYSAACGGVVARLGGDEFVALIPAGPAGLDLPALGAHLHHSLTQAPVAADGITVDVRASAGLSRLTPTADLYAAIELADQAMYLAKTSATNVVVAEQAPVALVTGPGRGSGTGRSSRSHLRSRARSACPPSVLVGTNGASLERTS